MVQPIEMTEARWKGILMEFFNTFLIGLVYGVVLGYLLTTGFLA